MSSLETTARPDLLDRLLAGAGVRPGEGVALLWSFVYFFALLCGYYTIRPVRDAMGAVHALEWLFTATFVVMLLLQPLYAALVGRFPRRVFLPVVYGFFILCLLGFYVLLAADTGASWRSGAFFVWVAVFNLFAVSVFWSFMSDIFGEDQARRLYGTIAAGGTLGALAGPLLTQALVQLIGAPAMLLVAAGLVGLCLIAIFRLIPWARARERGSAPAERAGVGGGILEVPLGSCARVFSSPWLSSCSSALPWARCSTTKWPPTRGRRCPTLPNGPLGTRASTSPSTCSR